MHPILQDEWPLLVIVPASLRLVWAEEVERWLPHVRPGQVTVIEGKEDRLCDLPEVGRRATLPQITITSYEMMKRLSCPACQKLPGHSGSGGGRGGRGGGRGGRGGRGAAAAAAGDNGGDGDGADEQRGLAGAVEAGRSLVSWKAGCGCWFVCHIDVVYSGKADEQQGLAGDVEAGRSLVGAGCGC